MPARKALIVTCWPITQGEREPGHNFTGLDEMRDHDRLVEAQRHTVEAHPAGRLAVHSRNKVLRNIVVVAGDLCRDADPHNCSIVAPDFDSRHALMIIGDRRMKRIRCAGQASQEGEWAVRWYHVQERPFSPLQLLAEIIVEANECSTASRHQGVHGVVIESDYAVVDELVVQGAISYKSTIRSASIQQPPRLHREHHIRAQGGRDGLDEALRVSLQPRSSDSDD
mmetsp:Transcript_30099/g.92161  ORF Transcript_30099/g.92161 Transcript_30099/m.92161 type:complete len:225 (+) Transcript_30099:868-1542(+)